MKLEFTKEELTTLLMGLYAGSEFALCEDEAREYDELADRIASILQT
jgi:hypothetical protein